MGHRVVAQVGTAGYRIDLAVRHPDQPGRFALGIECDGAMYHSSRVARDRDRLREQVLAGLGWTLHRIWGPSWYRDRPGEERRLAEAIERALLRRQPRPPPRAAQDRSTVDFEDVELDAPPAVGRALRRRVAPPAPAPLDISTDAPAASEIRQLVLTTVTEEAPIVEDLLIRRVIGAWGDVLSEKRRARDPPRDRVADRRRHARPARQRVLPAATSAPTSCASRTATTRARSARSARAGRRARRGDRAARRRRADRHRGGGQAARRAALRLGAQRPGDPGGAHAASSRTSPTTAASMRDDDGHLQHRPRSV